MPRLVHRPPVPPAKAKKILNYIRRGTTIANAAEVAGVHRDTLYDWVKRGERGEEGYVKFSEDVRAARAEAEFAIFMIVRRAMGAAKGPGSPDPTAAMWWLKVRNRPEYGDRVEHSGPDGGAIQHTFDVTKLSDEDLKKVIAGEYRPPTAPPTPAPHVPTQEASTDGVVPAAASGE